MKILVTGANGYIGMGVVKVLLDNGHEVIATDISDNNIDKRATIMLCNNFKIDKPFEYFKKPDAVLHLAWKNGFVHNDISHLEDISKHYLFLKEMIDAGLKHICVMGSMHEIGFFEGSINENTSTNPMSLYGIGKDALRRSLELLCMGKNICFQWLRGYYIVGNSKYGSSIFSKITEAENKGQKEFPFTSGTNQWDFLNYDEFCNQVSATVEQTEVNGIINICSGYPQKLSDVTESFIKSNGYKIKLKYGVFPDRKYDSKAVWGNNEKIEMIINNKEKLN